ncbi:MAG TPA: DUF2937 family protein [Steroidobacteraceae bacterium]
MAVIRGLLDRIVLLLGVVIAGCVPSFIAQYRQRASGRLEQVLADLAPFQQIADREHGGSLAQLVRYHLQSSDPTFHREGQALQSMLDAAERLRAMLNGLNTDLFHQSAYLLLHGDLGLARSTWSLYQPAFALTAQSILFALLAGVLLWLLFLALWHVVAWLVGRRRRRVGPGHDAAVPRPSSSSRNS